MDYKTLLITPEKGYVVVTLNRPNELNAFSHEMRIEMIDCFEKLGREDSARVVVITGGDEVFCAGMDLMEMAAMPDGSIDDYFVSISRSLEAVYTFKKPVIAAVSGIALGAGFNLATMCDLIVVSETAIFGHPELKFGLNPLFDPLRRIVGMAKAKEIALLGEPIGAKEALRIGLVNKVLPPEKFMGEAKSIAQALSARSSKALEAVKSISDITPRLDKSSALKHELEISALLFSRAERREHMKNFLREFRSRKKPKN